MPSILIIGASRGIGKQWIHHYLKKSNPCYKIFATCRNPEKDLTEFQNEYQNENVKIIQLDVSTDECIDILKNSQILPEQLDYLYQKYQIESNPSRKMLEQIANEVGLRKRVVQVWFQNTRARERKGQFRAHQQVINKRCPFCPAIFRVRSALESHLATKHADHYTRGEIDIDALPDADGGFLEPVERSASTPNSVPPLAPLVPTTTDQLHSMQKYYEDTMKRYMNDLQNNSNNISNNSREEPQPQPHLGDANVSLI